MAGDRWSLEVSSGALVANDAVSGDGGASDVAAEGEPRASTLCVVADRLAQISGAILVTGGAGELPQIHLRRGDVVNLCETHGGMERIKKLYSAKNVEAEVTPEASIDDERHIIDAIFRVKETAKGS